jgi:hypothetical protein
MKSRRRVNSDVMSRKSKFHQALSRTLKPKLESFGFKEVVLKDCIQPEFLFNRDELWFGASFDYRDRYLSLELGRLYWFQDVMPRVIVLGDYGDYCPAIKSISLDNEEAFTALASAIRDTLAEAIKIYNDRYDEILAARRNPKTLKYRREFFMHLGNEVSVDDVTRFAK